MWVFLTLLMLVLRNWNKIRLPGLTRSSSLVLPSTASVLRRRPPVPAGSGQSSLCVVLRRRKIEAEYFWEVEIQKHQQLGSRVEGLRTSFPSRTRSLRLILYLALMHEMASGPSCYMV